MIETLISASGLAFEAVIAVMVAVIMQRVGRIEKDVATLAEKTDETERNLARMEGRIEGLKRFN